MPRRTIWVLVCDAARARLLADDRRGRAYRVIETFDHPAGRAHARDLTSALPGRKPVGGPRGDGVHAIPGGFHGRPRAEPDTDPTDVEAQKFARLLAAALERGLTDHAYDGLVLAAPPRFLGLLRSTVSEQVRRHIEATVDKDLTAFEPREIHEKLRAEREGLS
jgi:protein required for attachment to host cells